MRGRPIQSANGDCFSYQVKDGDSCDSISKKFSVKIIEIEEWNLSKAPGFTGCGKDFRAGINICLSNGKLPGGFTPKKNKGELLPSLHFTNVILYQLNPSSLNLDTECGPTSLSNSECPLSLCCSGFGYCGITEEFCSHHTSPPCVSNCYTNLIRASCDGSQAVRKVGYFLSSPLNDVATLKHLFTSYTHVVFAFAVINPNSFKLEFESSRTADQARQFVKSVKEMGSRSILAVGGWEFCMGETTKQIFSTLLASDELRRVFVDSAIHLIEEYKFDGFDLDFEYPAAIERGAPKEDTPNFTALLRELRRDLKASRDLTVATPASFWFLKGFEIKEIAEIVTFVNVMMYDYVKKRERKKY